MIQPKGPLVTSPLRTALVAFATLLATIGSAAAHPHVWVSMKSELIYSPDGSVTGVRHAWTFDEMFSVFATQGIEGKKQGEFTQEELMPLAKTNVESLKEFDYFTVAKASGAKADMNEPADGYYLEFKNSLLTLHFVLPFKAAVKAKDLAIEIYDPSYFVDFAFAEKDPVKVTGAPAQCKLSVIRPDSSAGQQIPLDPENWGAQYASKIAVKCP
jgi:ABC-type uncharacterized transport system substrate-binding protein